MFLNTTCDDACQVYDETYRNNGYQVEKDANAISRHAFKDRAYEYRVPTPRSILNFKQLPEMDSKTSSMFDYCKS